MGPSSIDHVEGVARAASCDPVGMIGGRWEGSGCEAG
jgi:hypothetical protein